MQNLGLIESFDLKVEESFSDLKIDYSKLRIGAGISGGADSMAMLTSLIHFSKKTGASLFVITINHRIRSEEESGGDAQFVSDFCREHGISCTIHAFEKNLVEKTEKERNGGTEEAARYLRYIVFENFIAENNLDVFCLAHNQNDNLETIVMRFLQGASSAASGGIRKRRGKFLRPLLNVSRDEIETYLGLQNISWRTDNTNADNTYLRNRIRHKILPAFNSFFPGWKTALLAASEKNRIENDYLNSVADAYKWEKVSESCFSMQVSELLKIHQAVRNRLIYNALNKIADNLRIPFSFIKSCNKLIESGEEQSCTFADLQGRLCKDVFYIEKKINSATHTGFSAIIEKEGSYSFPSFNLIVSKNPSITLQEKDKSFENIYRADFFISVMPLGSEIKKHADKDSDTAGGIAGGITEDLPEARVLSFEKIALPFCVRSRQPGDEIKAADGNLKNVNDVFSGWAVPEEKRDFIPLLQDLSEKEEFIFAICGSVCGFKDWIVKTN